MGEKILAGGLAGQTFVLLDVATGGGTAASPDDQPQHLLELERLIAGRDRDQIRNRIRYAARHWI